ncbi:glycosyltransferase family 31 protein [Aspergillus novofumigatus IBT 16806]|uniref:N-acetylgalactosaminide beta-1,3-galactosyltransferase n=1 Tax=Aspergillus novofumigatus (strain IBT 16806) TaxID=1392255 RepID=A0A2I1CEZ0_ASPN1|nr:uncharacterized protein P174DRAFT_440797 [Aspergillus novofumigatus IBT 16806]PKX96213.1 hypothetical protein P174DRAFT_440797 [Aspergillus novofumigatus IBT 16806]
MPLFQPWTRLPSRRIYLLSPVIGLLLVYFFFCFDTDVFTPQVVVTPISPQQEQATCPPLPGIEDVLVILKTGVTEALEKVPVHFETTLRCVPNYVLFSDFEEEINGTRVHDVLRNVNETVKHTSPDFDLYNRIHEHGRSGLTPADLSRVPNTAFGMPDNPGWKLDKWKFLPLIDETLRVRDDAKWYVFMEADTYYIWSNLLQWLAKLDPNKPYYLGNPTQIGPDIFGHGGSGFILSREAMRRASELRAEDLDGWDRYTGEQWAGDCVLGRLLHDAGVPLLWSWPMLQSNTPAEFDHFSEAYFKKPWCFPAVSYHHVTAEDIHELAKFDHRFMHNNSVILHSDVFRHLVHPQFKPLQPDWDNLSDEEHDIGAASCQELCASEPECLQYSYEAGKCRTSKKAKIGVPKTGVSSGWMTDRIDAVVKELGSCTKPQWVLP